MKKLTKKQRWYLLRRYHKLNKLYKKKGNKNISTKNKDKTKPLRINAPAHFSLVSNENRASLLYFLNKIEVKKLVDSYYTKDSGSIESLWTLYVLEKLKNNWNDD